MQLWALQRCPAGPWHLSLPAPRKALSARPPPDPPPRKQPAPSLTASEPRFHFSLTTPYDSASPRGARSPIQSYPPHPPSASWGLPDTQSPHPSPLALRASCFLIIPEDCALSRWNSIIPARCPSHLDWNYKALQQGRALHWPHAPPMTSLSCPRPQSAQPLLNELQAVSLADRAARTFLIQGPTLHLQDPLGPASDSTSQVLRGHFPNMLPPGMLPAPRSQNQQLHTRQGRALTQGCVLTQGLALPKRRALTQGRVLTQGGRACSRARVQQGALTERPR